MIQPTLDGDVMLQSDIDLFVRASREEDERQANKHKRQTFSAEDIKVITQLATARPDVTDSQAVATWNTNNPNRRVCVSTVQKYRNFFERTGEFFVPREGGRPQALTEDEEQRWLEQLQGYRNGHRCVTTSFASAVARGILQQTRPMLLQEGVFVLGERLR